MKYIKITSRNSFLSLLFRDFLDLSQSKNMDLLKDESTHIVYFIYEAIIATWFNIFCFQSTVD
jgi:hypothetical protein